MIFPRKLWKCCGLLERWALAIFGRSGQSGEELPVLLLFAVRPGVGAAVGVQHHSVRFMAAPAICAYGIYLHQGIFDGIQPGSAGGYGPAVVLVVLGPIDPVAEKVRVALL